MPAPTAVRVLALAVLGLLVVASPGFAAELDRSPVDFVTPADITWVRNAAGTNESAILFGDPSKPGPYVMRIKCFSQAFFRSSGRIGSERMRLPVRT